MNLMEGQCVENLAELPCPTAAIPGCDELNQGLSTLGFCLVLCLSACQK